LALFAESRQDCPAKGQRWRRKGAQKGRWFSRPIYRPSSSSAKFKRIAVDRVHVSEGAADTPKPPPGRSSAACPESSIPLAGAIIPQYPDTLFIPVYKTTRGFREAEKPAMPRETFFPASNLWHDPRPSTITNGRRGDECASVRSFPAFLPQPFLFVAPFLLARLSLRSSVLVLIPSLARWKKDLPALTAKKLPRQRRDTHLI